MMKMNQKGFSVIEGLIVLIVLVGIGFAGWYVYDSRKSEDKKDSMSSESKKPDTKDEHDEVEYSTYDKNGINFEYPQDWKLNETSEFPVIESPDFKREGMQVENIISGAKVSISKTTVPQKDRTADNFQSWADQYAGDTENAKTITIDGKKAIQFTSEVRAGDGSHGFDSIMTLLFKDDGTRIQAQYSHPIGSGEEVYLSVYEQLLDTIK